MKQKKSLAENGMLISILASVISIVVGLLFGFILLMILNPAKAGIGMSAMLATGFSSMDQFGKVLYQSAPLMLCGLSVGFASKTGMFNIGASGQYTIGAFCALVGAIALQLPWYCCLVLALAGLFLRKAHPAVRYLLLGAALGFLWFSLFDLLTVRPAGAAADSGASVHAVVQDFPADTTGGIRLTVRLSGRSPFRAGTPSG